jgi:flagellar motility protein MotE (MotC chaperone)
MPNIEESVSSIQSQIITRLKSIHQQKQAKKDIVASYNETIKALEEEIDALMIDLEREERASIEEEATKILKAG